MSKKICSKCGKKLTPKNGLKAGYLCKKCNNIYRAALKQTKKEEAIKLFLENNKDVRQVDGYGGNYFVSNKGDIFRATVKGVKKLTPTLGKRGYYGLSFFYKGKRTTVRVHRIVALTWIPNPYPYIKKIINHIDADKLNNHVSNLEWCTYKQNTAHALKNGLLPVGEQTRNNKLTEEQVKEIYAARGVITVKDLSAKYGVSKRVITLIHQNKVWRHVSRKNLVKRRLLLNRKKKDG